MTAALIRPLFEHVHHSDKAVILQVLTVNLARKLYAPPGRTTAGEVVTHHSKKPVPKDAV